MVNIARENFCGSRLQTQPGIRYKHGIIFLVLTIRTVRLTAKVVKEEICGDYWVNNLNWSAIVGFAIAALIIFGFLIYWKSRQKEISLQDSTELQNYYELKALYAKLESDFEYALANESRYKTELAEMVAIINKFEQEQKSLMSINSELNNAKSRFEIENEHLKKSYQQLEQMTLTLKHEMSEEFTKLRNIAISELKERADSSLRDISKENVVLPLQEQFKDLQTKINELTLETKVINRNSQDLNEQAKNLALALTKDSKKKGEFGEMILSNILESVGLKKHVSYLEQVNIKLDNKYLIPDVVINLPHNRAVVIDSKNIMKSYYESIVNSEDNLRAIVDVIRITVKRLSDKDYLTAVESSIGRSVFDYIIMFIPNEGLFNLIVEEDQRQNGAILSNAYSDRVFIAGPSTLLVLLGIIERSWETYQVEERAEAVLNLASELSDKFKTTLQRVAELGGSLKQAGSRYDDVIKSLDNGTTGSAIGKLEKLVQLSGDKNNLARVNPLGEIILRLPDSYNAPN